MTQEQLIERTILFVKATLKGAEGGHDWFHIARVYRNATVIAEKESGDRRVIILGALLHDIADAKFHNGDETVGPELAEKFLSSLNVDKDTITHVVRIIEHISFKNSLDPTAKKFDSPELRIVQDADRLDAIGAIGIARAFNYGGYKNRELYNPDIAPDMNMDKAIYKKAQNPTINHFYEKLLLLKDKMNTPTGTKMAQERHDFMLLFLSRFKQEWDATQSSPLS